MAGNLVSNLLGLNNSGLNYGAGAVPIGMPMTFDENGNPIETGNALENANSGLSQQQAFLNALQGQNGLTHQSSVFDQQQSLANQMQSLAYGQGPNPALQQLQNTTGQNVSNQAALMASQRGSGANAGLMARQAAMQGAGIQQQAAGQGALMNAQQQIAAMQALQSQQNMLGGMANQQVGQYGNALTGYNQAAQSEQQNLLNALAQYNNANVAMKSNMNTANAHIAGITGTGQLGLVNQAIGGIGSASALLGKMLPGNNNQQEYQPVQGDFNPAPGKDGGNNVGGHQVMAHGGMVQGKSCYACGGMAKGYADGGEVNQLTPTPMTATPSLQGPQSFVGRYLYNSAPLQQSADLPSSMSGSGSGGDSDVTNINNDYSPSAASGIAQFGTTLLQTVGKFNDNGPNGQFEHGRTSGPTDPGEPINLNQGPPSGPEGGPPSGGVGVGSAEPQNAAKGMMVPGKAKVKGDNLKNDTVPAMLSPGEVVIPRHVMQSKDPVGNAAKFVQAVLAHQNMRKPK